MTASHFVQDFEGWLKGSPEYEIHILGQSGQTDSLTSYQCAGEHAGGYYAFDQNNLDWSGSVLLFSQQQLDSYRSQHPNQNFRVLAVEDDDGACAIRMDNNRFKTFITVLQNSTPISPAARTPRLRDSGRSSSAPTRSRRSCGRPTRSSPPRTT